MIDNENSSETKKWIVIMATFSILILFVFLYAIPQAFAQQILIDREGCLVKEFKGTETPFRVHISHDPAIRQRITDSHNDPGSRWIQDLVDIESEEPRTELGFVTNSTDDWVWKIELQYLNEKETPREVFTNFESAYQPLFTERLFHTGTFYCIVIDAQLKPQTVRPTEEEILKLADKMWRMCYN